MPREDKQTINVHVQPKAVTPQEKAFQHIVTSRRENFNKMFKGTTLVLGELRTKQIEQEMEEVTKKFKECAGLQLPARGDATASAASSSDDKAKGIKHVKALIQNCIGDLPLDDFAEVLGKSFIENLVREITPFAGIVSSGGKVAGAVYAVADDFRNLYKFEAYKEAFLPGDATAAADAVKQIIKVDTAKHAVDLAQHSVAFAAKISGALGDAGVLSTPAVGLGSALLSLTRDMSILAMQIKEMNAGNARLRTPETLDVSVFKECPVLGCYLLACSTTSDVANLCLGDMGNEKWMDRLETLKKSNMDPLLKISKEAIAESRIQLAGLESDKGLHRDPAFLARKLALRARVSKPLQNPAAVADMSVMNGLGPGALAEGPDFMSPEEAVANEAAP